MDNKNNKLLLSLTIFLGVLVIILGGYITYDKIIKQEEINNQNNKTPSNNITSDTISKLNNNKNWVYDANYYLQTNEESYYGTATQDKLISASDLIVPYINIDSDAAKTANQEIYKLYEDLIDEFNDNLKNKIAYKIVEYKTYLNSNILSVVITTEQAGTSIPIYEYYTYNFNLNNGKLLSYKEIYDNIGFEDNNINSNVEKAINNKMKKEYSNIPDFDIYNNKSINNYKTSVNTIKYFVNDNNKLNIIVTLEIPAGRGKFNTIITVK